MLSGDGDFTKAGVGNYSKINYKELFAAYKRMVIAARGSPWHRNLLSTWQKAIFPRGNAVAQATADVGNAGSGSKISAEDARRQAQGNEITNFLACLTIPDTATNNVASTEQLQDANTVREASEVVDANNAAPATETHQDQQAGDSEDQSHANSETDDNSSPPFSAHSEDPSSAAPSVPSETYKSAPTSQPRSAPRPSITDTEPDVPIASDHHPRALRRTYSFIDEPMADAPPPSSQLQVPALMQRSRSESAVDVEVASESTPFIHPSLQIAEDVLSAMGVDGATIPAANLGGTQRRVRSKKGASKQAVEAIGAGLGQVLNSRALRSRPTADGGA